MSIRIAINGYGRIGRNLHRQLIEKDNVEVVAINSRAAAESHAYLLRNDSLYGRLDTDISVKDGNLVVNGKEVQVLQIADPSELPWGELEIDIVIESTGKFTSKKDAKRHLDAGAKKVLITAPCKDPDIPNIVVGVNHMDYKPEDYDVVSNASCTTNCLAPVMKVLNDSFGVENACVTTIHAFTYTQNLLDNSNPEDFRRARATTESVIPTSTGAMKAIGRVIPELDGKIHGMAFRVPIPTVSVIDVVANLKKETSVEGINEAFKSAEKGSMAGVMGVSEEELVSVDFRADSRSSILDAKSTKVVDGKMAKVIAWYDNEWGYVSRVVDLICWFGC